ncbi:MAG TPA: glycine cleavage system protein H [Terriglobales bacterium]|nr:glycine cleavage system protein H [Terriglobales bacterium]
MSEYLEITIDKFIFRVAKDRLYTRDGVWLRPMSPQRVRLGVSDFFQQHNGDVAFVNVKTGGTRVAPGDEFADVETMKVTVGLPSPIAGTIVEVNRGLELRPELVNQDPYETGWLADIEPRDWQAAQAELLDASAYLAVMQAQAAEELKS